MATDIERAALRAARAAGRVHLNRLRRITVTPKSNTLDLVTEADREAEEAVIEVLQRTFPTHSVLAEESGPTEHISDHRWIIDPLDGTTNFTHGFPQFCVSIAYERRGRLRTAVIFDALKKECFVALRGMGARLNGRPIHVSDVATLSSALLASGFPYDRRQRPRFYLAFWEAFMMRCQGVRRVGSAALDLAYVACGRLDGFWEFGLNPWDVAAGALLVQEAGGRVTNMDGSAFDMNAGQIVAANGLIHPQLLQTIAQMRPEAERRHREMLRESEPAA